MSLLFAVFHAITGSKAAPATHNMPRDCRHVLQHMANRADNDSHLFDFAAATVEADANLCAAVVRRCIAELAARGWLVFHGWSGPRNNAHRVYEVRAEGSGWPKSTTMAREAPPLRRARLAPTPRVTPGSASTPGVAPGCDGVSVRGDTGCCPGVTPGVDLPPDLPPLLPLREPLGALARSPEPVGKGETADHAADPPATEAATAPPPPPPGKKRKKPCTELPADWTPKPAAFALGASFGFSRERVESEAAMFVDRSKAKGQMWVEWDAAFHNALRLAKKWELERGGGAARGQVALPLSAMREPMIELPRAPPAKGAFDKPESIVRASAEIKAKLARGEFVETDPMKVLEEVCKKIAPARVDP